ncbi:MAG: hypothetical protein A2Y03_04765 [Omnitrophica WOR_2 bacterium GWF2_38_59]|nr:MAG: hypothetical protein A2Y06_02230 [Omnitrophica WOR_2 bacterium GWA2_37_7]OGX25637.1 MAG: hypothetical protein A2Y03_04765 [Omnitrophica WOR_2 bacterium GWF2_38_59]OGX54737.1 MAG: hypothetical protein A2267_05955 [Omnitrophica WOR_2 bacterium RIFOXYA12_FULL_38_10]OGX55103.1 MAG: hypothetical protein A2447_02910 [Omnitrophica WOR_2 bacterium RIFOXYC2_FULL_38_12]OGX59132.1 MAG: hypothetical protein A2306_08570 [Omnitrophica WOR_2 bacterium RIFOXYB2_FULL_38_16]
MSFLRNFWKKDSGGKKNDSSPGRWQVGDKIANRYEIYQIIGGEGKSGMGIVYVCYDHEHKNIYVLKTLQDKLLISKESQGIFEREALVWTHLERYHYIVCAKWVERLEERLFIILEYIAPDQQGRNTLSHYLSNLTLPDALKFAIQFCYGMEYAYSKGVDSHRDIKPDNIMITSNKTIKITDFGFAKACQEIGREEGNISSGKGSRLSIFKTKQRNRVDGTFEYISPEGFDGYADKRSDIYAFGIMLYQMVRGGEFPFVVKGKNLKEVEKAYEKLHKYEKVPLISSPLSSVIQGCLEKDPNKRFQDFASIREQLEGLLLRKTAETFVVPEYTYLEAWELINKGIALGNLGRQQEAIVCFDEATKMDPRDPFVWYNKGIILRNLGRQQEAIACYDKAIEIDPVYARAWNNKGIALENLGRSQEAIACYDKALEIDPRDASIWSNKGAVLANLGRQQEAIACYDKALEIDPRDASVWSNKGAALGNLGIYQEEIACYDKAIEIDQRHAASWYNKGITLGNLDRPQEAIACYDKAIEIDPKYARPWYNKGNVLGSLGMYKEAIACYDKALEIDPRDVFVWSNKGTSLGNLGRYQEAIACYDKAIEINPRYARAWNNKGNVLGSLGRQQEANACYGKGTVPKKGQRNK